MSSIRMSCMYQESFSRLSLKMVSLERASCWVKVMKNLFFRKGSVFVFFFLCLALFLTFNKNTSSSCYSVFCTIDISLCLKHLAEPAYSEFYTLFS